MIANFVTKWIVDLFKKLDWTITQMDMTQWGIVSVVFVIVGFMALRTRI